MFALTMVPLVAATPVGVWLAVTSLAPETERELTLRTPDAGVTLAPALTASTRPGVPRPPAVGGWPVDLGLDGAGYPYTPTLFDADGDGADEIFLTGGHTFGLRGDGSFLPGWPTAEMQHMGYGTNGSKPGPSVADVDGDGDGAGEVLWSLRDWFAGNSRMWSFNGRRVDGTDLPGFPQEAVDEPSNAIDTPFVLGDTDGDGDLEAWGAHTLGNTFVHYRVSAFDHTGARLFTVDLDAAENVQALYYGDVDGDGTDEMFAVSWLDPSFRLHVFHADGSEKPGYPRVLLTLQSGFLMFGPPVPFDLDGDGDLEILLGHWGGGRSWAECVHHDGTPCDGFPIQIASRSQLFFLGLGDVTADRTPELIAFDNHLDADYRVHAYDLASGSALPGWPFVVGSWPKSFPTVVDVDADAVQDVCFATDAGLLYAVSGTGAVIDGYPLVMASPSISGVAAGDIDGDGRFDLVAATWDGFVYAWPTPAPARADRADWPLRGVDARNTGVYRTPRRAGDVDGDGTVDFADILALLATWGPCPEPPADCPADFDDNDLVDFADLLVVLSNWG